MAKPTKFQFVLKSDPDKTKPALLYVMYTMDKRYKISLQESVLPQWWDKETQRAIAIESGQQKQVDTRNAKRVNRFLDHAERSFTSVFEQFKDWRKVKPAIFLPSMPSQIERRIREVISFYHKTEIQEVKKQTQTPSQFFEAYIAKLPTHTIKRTGTVMRAGTIGNHKIVLKRFQNFLSFANLKDDFSIFDKWYEGQMESYLLTQCGHRPNTVCATFSVMKVWLKQAEAEGLISDKSFHSWKSKGTDVEHIYLNENELKVIWEIPFSEEFNAQNNIDPNSSIEITRDVFIMASQVGLRFSDMRNLNTANWNVDERWVEIHTQKTGETVKVPLSSIAIEIYKKYGGIFPTPVDKSKFNTHLTKICELAGITQSVFMKDLAGGTTKIVKYRKCELVTSHTARRSFATNLYKKCKDARMVMKFTGHKTEENFRKYICIDRDEVVEMAMQYFN